MKRPENGVSEADMDAMLVVPAVSVNRFYVTVGDGVRLTFAECVNDGPSYFRSSVSMSISSAVNLKNILVQMLAAHEAGGTRQ